MFYVYELRDESGRPFYVGKGSGRRMWQHEINARAGRRSHLCAKLRKMQARGQQVKRVMVFLSPNEAEAFAEEKRLIAYYGRENLTNQTDGGEGPSNPTAETRAKIAASRRGVIASEATRNRQRLAHLGKHHTEATKARISARQRGTVKPWAKESRSNLGNGFKGRKWSAAQRAKFSVTRAGHPVSASTRKKISEAKKGSIPWNKHT